MQPKLPQDERYEQRPDGTIRRFRQHIGMLCGKKIKLSLHKCKRSAKLMGCISGELSLSCKALVETVEHTVE